MTTFDDDFAAERRHLTTQIITLENALRKISTQYPSRDDYPGSIARQALNQTYTLRREHTPDEAAA
jgi:hypothetical protein